MKYLAVSILSCFFLVQETLGHGAMYFPTPWWATKECSPNSLPWSCVTGLDFGSTGCTAYTGLADEDFEKVKENNYYEHKDSPPGCSKKMELTSFFTNFTFVEKRTLDDKFIDKDADWKTPEWRNKYTGIPGGLHPWNSPGAAKTFGNGCGANGGNPFPQGCYGEDKMYGRCCAGKIDNWGCGGFVGGMTADEMYMEGYFTRFDDNDIDYVNPLVPFVTTWERGSNQEVYWKSKAYHRGGYAYRLCKAPDWKLMVDINGVPEVNEECFQNGHLKFAGDKTWTYELTDENFPFNPDNFVEEPIIKTTIGTTPEGSEWAKVNLPPHKYGENHWAFKDLVEVPEDLEPGEYILSFRWDCQQSPQVWNSCANIAIV